MSIPKSIEERLPKLPQWAQRHINKLHRDIEGLKAERHHAESGESRVHYVLYENVGVVYPIPDSATVVFQTANGTVEVSLRNEVVEVRALNELVVEPRAANMVCMDNKPWRWRQP